ncbi:unnamed protein product, partial [marine sediment metagenome]
MTKLEVGEKYLSGSIGGKEGLKVAFFKNKNKKKPTDPDYTGTISLALWVASKKAPSA